jgi:hypothetical protein
LWRFTDADANADSDTNSNGYANSNSNTDSDANANADTNAHSNACSGCAKQPDGNGSLGQSDQSGVDRQLEQREWFQNRTLHRQCLQQLCSDSPGWSQCEQLQQYRAEPQHQVPLSSSSIQCKRELRLLEHNYGEDLEIGRIGKSHSVPLNERPAD